MSKTKKKSKSLEKKIQEYNERSRKEGTLISDENWRKIWPKNSVLIEQGNWQKRWKSKKSD